MYLSLYSKLLVSKQLVYKAALLIFIMSPCFFPHWMCHTASYSWKSIFKYLCVSVLRSRLCLFIQSGNGKIPDYLFLNRAQQPSECWQLSPMERNAAKRFGCIWITQSLWQHSRNMMKRERLSLSNMLFMANYSFTVKKHRAAAVLCMLLNLFFSDFL